MGYSVFMHLAAAKNPVRPSKGMAEGGCGGNSASPEPKRSPAALLVQSRATQKSFLFLSKKKTGRGQTGKSKKFSIMFKKK